MKKSILGFALLVVAIGCKKVPDGGNKNILKLEEGVERYDTYETRGTTSAHAVAEDTTAVESDTLSGIKKEVVQGKGE